ncbi:ACT domain-containing protein [Erythrobacter tepidarius]|uniref:ACT domain-containing protein n=1 Tax=Erythrobacter tepidarius TaxID=60454 RepID=UPI001FE609BA|nr:ACT domain-containing protein [Erythrobacter tepidarius]
MTQGQPVSALAAMLAGLAPELDGRAWFFVVVEGEVPPDAFAVIREDEGTTAIVAGVRTGAPFARITLTVLSALEGVGLTAAVSGALSEAGIACNFVAGYHHDHLFVPWDRREEALAVLQGLAVRP